MGIPETGLNDVVAMISRSPLFFRCGTLSLLRSTGALLGTCRVTGNSELGHNFVFGPALSQKSHSSLSALFGSTPAARLAGIQDDAVAIAKKSSIMAINVSGSVDFTATSIGVVSRSRLLSLRAPGARSLQDHR